MSCAIDDCPRPRIARGLCGTHYYRLCNGLDLKAPVRGYRFKAQHCSVDDCGRPVRGGGYCVTHYKRVRRGQELDRPIRSQTPGEWGIWTVDGNGYIHRRRTQDGVTVHQMQHRHVMEQSLGRELLPEETVHHINGVRTDNRLENLELWSSSHPKGQRVADKVEWALEIISRYAPDRITPQGVLW